MTTRAGGDTRTAVSVWLRHHASDILADWQARVRKAPAAQHIEQPLLLTFFPDLIDRIADLADELGPGGTSALQQDATERLAIGGLDEGFDPTQVVLEYSLLRESMLRALDPRHVSFETLLVLNQALDRAVEASIAQYTRARERAQHALRNAEEVHRFLSECSKQLAQSIEYEVTLANITRLAVPGIADWCVADLLDDGRIRRVSVAHVDPAKVRLPKSWGGAPRPTPMRLMASRWYCARAGLTGRRRSRKLP